MNSKLPPPTKFYRRAHRVIGPCFHSLGISCRHFAELTLVSMDRPLTLREKFRRSLHFFSCSVCRGFNRQMDSLTALVRSSFANRETPEPEPEFLSSVRDELTRLSAESPPEKDTPI
jgi:hypothetical protein